MFSINLGDVNNAEIITFLSVARTLNMSVSANELHLTQPAVSQRISRLEKTYGLMLFKRRSNGLQLTPAGKAFYEEMSTSFVHIEAAFAKAYTAQTGTVTQLNIGHDGTFDYPLLLEIVKEFKKRHPTVNARVFSSINESCEELFIGSADVLIRPTAGFESIQDYVEHKNICAFQFCILIAEGNPLYHKENVTIEDIIGQPLTVAHMNSDSPYVITIKEIFDKHGQTPSFEQTVQHETLCFSLLSTGGISVASPSFWERMNARAAQYFRERIKVHPIKNEFYPVSFVWKRDDSSPYLKDFFAVYDEMLMDERNAEIVWQSYNGFSIPSPGS